MKKIKTPISEDVRKTLKVGEKIYLSGTIYTARDAAHKKLCEMIANNEPLPFDLKDATIYYVGPTKTPPHANFGSAGPTTSTRMDAYTPTLLNLGLGSMIGKGYRTDEVKKAITSNNAVYFVAIGGAGAYLSQCIHSSEDVAFLELESEAIRKLEVINFPVFVGIDCLGNDIYND